jgi:hypothetical protein
VGDLHGCSFRARCGFARASCEADIALRPLGVERAYRCILSPEESARAAVAEAAS